MKIFSMPSKIITSSAEKSPKGSNSQQLSSSSAAKNFATADARKKMKEAKKCWKTRHRDEKKNRGQ